MSKVNTEILWAPFTNPVQQAQQAFRKIMGAMAEPGKKIELATAYQSGNVQEIGAPDALASFVIALTLLDQSTKVWLSTETKQTAFQQNLLFHCGCQIIEDSRQADFVFIKLSELENLEPFKQGSESYPHHSATIIAEVSALNEHPNIEIHAVEADQINNTLSLKGPGIPVSREVTIQGLRSDHVALMRENHDRFPMGHDFMFTCRSHLLGIPRSTDITFSRDSAQSGGLDNVCSS